MKKILSVILGLALCCMLVALPVCAEETAAPVQAETAEIGDGHVTLVSDSDQLIPVYVDEEAEGAEGTVEQAMADFSVGGTIAGLVNDSGIYDIIKGNWKSAVMILISFVLLYLAIVKQFEPLLLVPIAFGMLITNLPGANMFHEIFFAGGHIHWDLIGGQPVTASLLADLHSQGVAENVLAPYIQQLMTAAQTTFSPEMVEQAIAAVTEEAGAAITALEAQLQAADAAGARVKLIATDGVFSMDGIICNLKGVCDLADKYNALVMVDDSHAVGFVGAHGRGTSEYCGVEGRVDIITGTLGKALGGASGGYTSGRKEIIDLLRQRSRPYLFSNSLAPAIAGASIEMFNMLEESTELRDHLEEVTAYYRKQLVENGFDIIEGTHPCVPVMLYDERLAGEYAKKMMEKGVYVVAFSYPVVPKGKARIRTQVCASHTKEDIDFIIKCFKETREEIGK